MLYLTTHSTHFIYGYNGVGHMVKDHSDSERGNALFNDALNTFYLRLYGRKEGNLLFNDTHNTFYLWLYGVGHMVKDHLDSKREEMLYLTTHSTHFTYGCMEGRKEMFYLTTHSTHFYLRLYGVGHMVKDHLDCERGNALFIDALNTFYLWLYGRKEGNDLFNDALNTFYLRLYGVGRMVKDHLDSEREEMLYLTMNTTHFIYGYMALDIW